MTHFMLATGIENSYPTIAGGVRVDEMERCGHYGRWREDLDLAHGLGLTHLRWGPALYRTFLGPGRYDWDWADEVLAGMERLGLGPILDLCHFGLPDWLGNFQNPDFPAFFAEYAGACARRYPRVQYWTPVNEPLVTALFSAKYGWWNERLTSEEAFVRATLNVCRATVLAMRAIHATIPEAVFVQSESCEYTHPSHPGLAGRADFENQRRFLPLDLIFGHPLDPAVDDYLRAHGARPGALDFFRGTPAPGRCVLGTDYYATNEHLLKPDGSSGPAGDLLGYYAIARQYYERYGLELMHTETNRLEGEGSVNWLWKQWHGLWRLRQDGIPVRGFTWYSLTDQVDWDTALREDAGRVNAVGLFDLDRRPRPVGLQYQRLVREWGPAVTESGNGGLDLPAARAA